MKSGYKIVWTDCALDELAGTIEYLEKYFTEKELKKLAREIEKKLNLISENPLIFPVSDKINLRKVVVEKYNTLYYRIKEEGVEIISFFSNMQSPAKRKF